MMSLIPSFLLLLALSVYSGRSDPDNLSRPKAAPVDMNQARDRFQRIMLHKARS
jgi:hypothetical protein